MNRLEPLNLARFTAIALAGLLCLCAGPPAEAWSVRRMNLEQMTAHAERIVSGRVLEARVLDERVMGFPVTEIVLEIDRAVKGRAESKTTLRMLGAYPTGTARAGPVTPTFRDNEAVVLFLYGASELGLTSPVGLAQGKFTVVTDKQGRRRAVNPVGNRGLFANLSDDARERLGVDTTKTRPEPTVRELLDKVELLLDPRPSR